MPGSPRQKLVLVRAGALLCGLPIDCVMETMRPLPVWPIAGAPAHVLGVAIVRGDPVPVVDLALFLGSDAAASAPAARFVTIRAGGRAAALAVSAVVGISEVDPAEAQRLPLVADACAGALEALRTRDDDLLLVLGAARLFPAEAQAALAGWEADA